MTQLAIKGHTLRGKEVIEILEMLGGNSNGNIKGYNDDLYYYIAKDGLIYGSGIKYEEFACNYTIFTLEEFLEKYPYKVGDKVILDDIPCTITWMCWECNNIYYQIQGIGDAFTKINKKVTAEKLKPYKEETMGDKDMSEHTLEINLNHPCFDGHNKIELIIPENWKFEQRGNKMFGIRKYPQYPKTYGECCKIIDYHLEGATIIGYEKPLLENLQQLLICRDAYWKIAGEQMGLGKPWVYDMSKDEFSYAISYQYGSIQKCEVRYRNHFLVFPTKEMRDAFYANFKDLIESCKELL